MTSSEPVEDRLAIRALRERFADAVIRRDEAAWQATWAEDAYWRIPTLGIEASGRNTIVAMWKQAMDLRAFVGFFASHGPTSVQGEQAQGTCYYQEIQTMKTGHRRYVIGFYTDELVKQAGDWRFLRRTYKVLYDADKGVLG